MKKIAKILSVAMLVVMTALVMTACVPGSAEKAKKKLEKAGYTVEVVDLVEESTDIEGGLYQVAAFVEVEDDYNFAISVIYFDTKDNAEAWYNEYKEAIGDDEEGITVHIKGKVVYWGTEQGVKDFD